MDSFNAFTAAGTEASARNNPVLVLILPSEISESITAEVSKEIISRASGGKTDTRSNPIKEMPKSWFLEITRG